MQNNLDFHEFRPHRYVIIQNDMIISKPFYCNIDLNLRFASAPKFDVRLLELILALTAISGLIFQITDNTISNVVSLWIFLVFGLSLLILIYTRFENQFYAAFVDYQIAHNGVYGRYYMTWILFYWSWMYFIKYFILGRKAPVDIKMLYRIEWCYTLIILALMMLILVVAIHYFTFTIGQIMIELSNWVHMEGQRME